MLGRARALALALAAAGALGCTPAVDTLERPALQDLRAPLHRIAVIPLRVSPGLAARGADSPSTARVSAQLVSRYLAEALEARGLEVVAPDDAAGALALAGPSQPAAAVLAEKFGADGILSGELTRWEERQGEAVGTLSPAAVGFHVDLRSAPGGSALWSAEFDERQQALGDNVLRAGRYPGGGTRWLTAAELAQWGAQETIAAMPTGK